MDIGRKACSGDRNAESELRSIADTATFWNGNSVCAAIFSTQQRGCIHYCYVAVYRGSSPEVSCFPLPSSFNVAAIAYNVDLFYFVSEDCEIRISRYLHLAATWDNVLSVNPELIHSQGSELFYEMTSG